MLQTFFISLALTLSLNVFTSELPKSKLTSWYFGKEIESSHATHLVVQAPQDITHKCHQQISALLNACNGYRVHLGHPLLKLCIDISENHTDISYKITTIEQEAPKNMPPDSEKRIYSIQGLLNPKSPE